MFLLATVQQPAAITHHEGEQVGWIAKQGVENIGIPGAKGSTQIGDVTMFVATMSPAGIDGMIRRQRK